MFVSKFSVSIRAMKRFSSSSSRSSNEGTSKKKRNEDVAPTNDDEEEDDEDDEDNSDDEDDEDEDEGSITRVFFLYADNLLIQRETVTSPISLQKVEKALNQCVALTLAKDDVLSKMYEKGKTRDMTEAKVPPGSANVRRTLMDDRFLLSSACIGIAKIHDMRDGPMSLSLATRALQDALIFFPRSAEANEFLARLLKTQADDLPKLSKVEFLLRRGASSLEEIKGAITTLSPFVKNTSSGSSSSGDATFSGAPDLSRDVMLLEREHASAELALEALSLLLCQSERFDDAMPLLQGKGFQLRLSKEVLCYQPVDVSVADTVGTSEQQQQQLRTLPVRVVDRALSPEMLSHLQHVFRPTSPFWREHYYDTVSNASRAVGYFSYIFPLRSTMMSPRCSIEQIIVHLYNTVLQELFPEVNGATVAEWWVHSRPHCSGHQLHFDSDETAIEAGCKAQHPICSLVIYLGGDNDSDAGVTSSSSSSSSRGGDVVGGPTLVTNQRLGGELASQGWLCYPKCNRLAVFDAQYLHGVISGRGPNPGVRDRRLTFMVGFWKSIKAQARGVDKAGPGQPFPDTEQRAGDGPPSAYTWHKEMSLRSDFSSDAKASSDKDTGSYRLVAPVPVSTVWEPVVTATATATAEGKTTTSSSSSSSSSSGATILGKQTVPYNQCFQGF